jgi:aryl-alcohol dehydrogenase-like predicted oxidoreductase
MQYQILGRSSLNISRIGFGCMSLKPDQKDIQAVIDEAVSKGINYFDTADLYDKGMNEINIGNALKTKRHEIILASKVGNEWRSDGNGWDWNPRKDHILKAVEESLRRLQTDYIDLYQLHGGTINDPINETIETFELLKQQGKIRYYGISSIRPNVIREYVQRSHIVSVMMQYSLLDRRPAESCLQLLEQNNIAVLARGSVASGLLIDKPAKPYLNYSETEVSDAAKAIRQLVTPKRNAAHIALQFVLQRRGITSAIVGIRTKKQVTDAIQAINLPLLTEQELHILDKVIPSNYYLEHR